MKEDLAVLREAKEHPCFLVAENPPEKDDFTKKRGGFHEIYDIWSGL